MPDQAQQGSNPPVRLEWFNDGLSLYDALSLYDRCAQATSFDEHKEFAGNDGLSPAVAQWDADGRLLEVQFISTYSGKPAVHYRYDR